MNPEETGFKVGIIDAEDQEIAEISQFEPGKREVPKGRLAAGLALMLTGYLTTACGPIQAREPTPEVTETTGIPPTPTLEITPTPTFEPTPTITEVPTATPKPEPTKTPTPEPTPVPTVTVEARGYGGWTVDEQKKADDLRALYEANTEGTWGTIWITHGDEYGEIGVYFDKENRSNFWLLVEREGKVLEEVPRLQGTTIIWNPNEVRFEYQPQGVPHNWLWRSQERMVYDPVYDSYVAQWNPETSSWNMNPPEPEPTNWTYIEGVEHVKFAEFNQEQLQMLKEAAALVKQYDPERFALFEREIDWVVLGVEGVSWGGRHKIWVNSGYFEPRGFSREKEIFILAGTILGHEFQHSIQAMEGRDFAKTCPVTGVKVSENEADKAALELIKKIRQGISEENLKEVDEIILIYEEGIDKNCSW